MEALSAFRQRKLEVNEVSHATRWLTPLRLCVLGMMLTVMLAGLRV